MQELIVNAFIECFWSTATALVPVIPGLIALCVIFVLVRYLLWK